MPSADRLIAVVGGGRVGRTLAAGWARAGHPVVIGSRAPEAAPAPPAGVSIERSDLAARAADVVVLALPFRVVLDALRELGAESGAWAGKVVVDLTNPVPGPPPGAPSGAALVAAAAPGARVVKAFNHVGVEIMADPRLDGRPVDLLLCGDDADATATVAGLARDLGFAPIEAGPLRLATELEALARLWMGLARMGRDRRAAFAWLREGST